MAKTKTKATHSKHNNDNNKQQLHSNYTFNNKKKITKRIERQSITRKRKEEVEGSDKQEDALK